MQAWLQRVIPSVESVLILPPFQPAVFESANVKVNVASSDEVISVPIKALTVIYKGLPPDGRVISR
jgi:hypothetical protein